MFGQILTISRNTLVESIRQPIFIVIVLAAGLLQIVNTLLAGFTMGFTEQTEVSADNKMLFELGLATVVVCALLLAAFVATNVLSREIENKTVLTVMSKPVGRPVFIIGKYLGVTGAILIATAIMTIFFFFAIRHQVMSTARDHLDQPVVLFSTLAVVLPLALAIWGNYFYGWVFSSTAITFMLPASLIAYLLTLSINKEWAFQALGTDFKPQLTVATACATMAVIVLTAVAVAASTRLGQVMTIVVCFGIFMLGLLSNHLLGRHAFSNQQTGVIKTVQMEDGVTLARAGQRATIGLSGASRTPLTPGTSIYFARDPSGLGMEVPSFTPFEGNPADEGDVRTPKSGPALIVSTVGEDNTFTVINAGGLAVRRPPVAGDFVFTKPTVSHWAARVAWSLVPNIQSFWLVDAVTQGHRIPLAYISRIAGYAGLQVITCLSLAVMLFQRRDVG